MATKIVSVWPVNETGEIVVEAGTGTTTVAGVINQDNIPTNPLTNKAVVKFPGQFIDVVSSAAPSNSDGRPDGTIYLQTA